MDLAPKAQANTGAREQTHTQKEKRKEKKLMQTLRHLTRLDKGLGQRGGTAGGSRVCGIPRSLMALPTARLAPIDGLSTKLDDRAVG